MSFNYNTWGKSFGVAWGDSWGIASKVPDAKSGYWRLFYYQMQEDALNEQKQGQKAAARKSQPTEEAGTPVPAARSKRKLEPLVKLESYTPVKPAPTILKNQPLPEGVSEEAKLVLEHLHHLSLRSRQVIIQLDEDKQRLLRRAKLRRDEEEFLLLAA